MTYEKILDAMNRIDSGATVTFTLKGGTSGTIKLNRDQFRYDVNHVGKTQVFYRQSILVLLESARKVNRS